VHVDAVADADSGKSIPVNNPATARSSAPCPTMGAGRDPAAQIGGGHPRFPPGALEDRQERATSCAMVRPDDGEPGDLARSSRRAGQPLAERAPNLYGASFIEWFADEPKAHLGDTSGHQADKAHRRQSRAIGVCAADHAVEFPQRHDPAQIRPRARGRLHHVLKPADRDTLLALAMAELGERAEFPKASSVAPGSSAGDRRGDHLQSDRAQVTFTGFDRGRQSASGSARRP